MREADNVEGEPPEDIVRDQSGSQSEYDETTESDYYYDDSTGYEVYREDENESAAEPEADQSNDRPADV
jgi:hypothetical protein